jgi:uncharacterized delta-60 repeat protein
MKLRNLSIRRAAAGVSLGGLALSLMAGCETDDALLLDGTTDELEPSRNNDDDSPNASDSDDETADDDDDGTSSEAPPTLGRDDETDPTPPVTPAPAPIEYWTDGVTVDGVSPDVDDRYHGVTMDAQDNAYGVGYIGAAVGENRRILVTKFDSNGQPATGFGSNGRVEVDFSSYLGTPVSETLATADANGEEGRDIALQSDGKIVVVGRAEDPNDLAPTTATPIDIVVFRLDASGARDLTFGTAGVTVLNPANGPNELAWGTDVDASNRIYVFGHGLATNAVDAVTPRTDQDRYVWRLNPDGTLDTTFANQGVFTFDVPNGTTSLALNDNSRRGSVMPDGKIVIGGYTNVAGRNQIVLAKLHENGVADTGFSTDGIVRLAPFPTGMAECYGVAWQSDGSLVTTGYGNVNVERTGGAELLDMVSFRVRPDGSSDSSWGVGGALVYDPAGAQDRGRDVVALADDRVLFAGAATVVGTNKDAMLLLTEKNGAIARNFDPAGHKVYDFGGDNEEFFSVRISPSGKFAAAAGYATGTGLTSGNAILAIVPLGK